MKESDRDDGFNSGYGFGGYNYGFGSDLGSFDGDGYGYGFGPGLGCLDCDGFG